MGDKVVWLREALCSTLLHLKLALKQKKNIDIALIILTLLFGDEKHQTVTTLRSPHNDP